MRARFFPLVTINQLLQKEIHHGKKTYKSAKEVKLENEVGIVPSKEFPWNRLQIHYDLADNKRAREIRMQNAKETY